MEQHGARAAGAGGRHGARRVVQGVAFAACLGVMVWVVMRAINNPDGQVQLQRLKNASLVQVGVLLLCSLMTIVIGGLVFRAMLSPQRRLRRANVVALNGVVSLLSYLPFKMGLAFRVFWHHRRDGLPLLTIAAWLAATAAVILSGLVPPILATVWRGHVDAWWWVAALVGVAVAGVMIVVVARPLAGERGLARLTWWADGSKVGLLSRVVRSERFGHLHGCAGMLASGPAVAEALALRTLDVGVQATRLWVAAGVCGVALEPGQAVVAGTLYFFFQATSPGGVAGAREGGTVVVMHWLGGADLPDLSVVVLTASLAEMAMNVVCAGCGAVWLWWNGRSTEISETR